MGPVFLISVKMLLIRKSLDMKDLREGFLKGLHYPVNQRERRSHAINSFISSLVDSDHNKHSLI